MGLLRVPLLSQVGFREGRAPPHACESSLRKIAFDRQDTSPYIAACLVLVPERELLSLSLPSRRAFMFAIVFFFVSEELRPCRFPPGGLFLFVAAFFLFQLFYCLHQQCFPSVCPALSVGLTPHGTSRGEKRGRK